MDESLSNSLSKDYKEESLNLVVDQEAFLNSKTIFSQKDNLVDKMSEKQLEAKGVNGHVENGSQIIMNGESPHRLETPVQKVYSPTLIGSAIQVMKNLFSPDKSKALSPNTISPINQQRSASGSPRSSIFIPGNTDIFSSEPGVGILFNAQCTSGDNILINLPVAEIAGFQSPLAFEANNSTDDSFLTTTSLIDDSFHSALTHVDENGEALKNGTIFMDNILNSSQGLDLLYPYNETLENNESYLENTTLINGNYPSLGSKMYDVSILDAGRNVENLNNTQGCLFSDKKPHPNGTGKNEDNIREYSRYGATQKEQFDGSKEGSPEKAHHSLGYGSEKSNEKLKVANIFANKSFKEPSFLHQNETERESNKAAVKDGEINVEKSISTTTVVLNTPYSVELDTLGTETDDFEAYIPSCFSDGISSSEDELHRKPSNELPCKQSDSNFLPAADSSPFFPEKKCASEASSPNPELNLNKLKLNKSDELIGHRNLSESPERERLFPEKKSSVDVSVIKKSESSEITKESDPLAKVTEEISISQSPSNPLNPVTVFSQQSYTVLSHDDSLNRPVIEPLKIGQEHPETETFQTMQSDGTFSADMALGSLRPENSDKPSQAKQSTPIWEGNDKDCQKFFRPAESKLQTPDGKKGVCSDLKDNFSNNSEISPVNPIKDSVFTNENVINGSCYSDGFDPDATRILQSEESKASGGQKLDQMSDKKQQSPRNASQVMKKNSQSPNNKKSQSKQTDTHKLNQTFDKNSPKPKILNSTFIKKRDSGESEKGNQTFDVSPEAVEFNKTYDKYQMNETFDKNLGCSLMSTTQILESPTRNDTYIKEIANGCQAQELNKTFEKKEATGEDAKECGVSSEADIGLTTDFQEKKNDSFNSAKSSISVFGSDVSTLLGNEDTNRNESLDDLSEKLQKIKLEENGVVDSGFDLVGVPSVDLQTEEKLLESLKDSKLGCDPDLVQLIQEQFSPNDIEKICNVVQDFSSMKLSNDILRASEQFDKSFHENLSDVEFNSPEVVLKQEKSVTPLSPQSLDFLNSIRGKPTGRDLSRESLYVKFDPLVQPSANSLIDFTKEAEALAVVDEGSPTSPHSTSICEQLLAISPQKKSEDIVPPLTPLSQKVKAEDKTERLKELQNEIYFLKNLYAERERTNKAKMEDWESQIAKLTSSNCFLEDKLKESNEREKSLVKKIKEQNENLGNLKIIMEEYVKVISKLTEELEALKKENTKEVESLSQEKDSYMTHLQNTEAAFTDVHTKYEKSKRTIAGLKTNEVMYRNTIAEQAQKLEEFKSRTREVQEKTLLEFRKMQEELGETKSSHAQEIARLRAQLRKTELKVEALQESLDQKIKENQQLTAICDELIEGKK